jgi:hypothetical protein
LADSPGAVDEGTSAKLDEVWDFLAFKLSQKGVNLGRVKLPYSKAQEWVQKPETAENTGGREQKCEYNLDALARHFLKALVEWSRKQWDAVARGLMSDEAYLLPLFVGGRSLGGWISAVAVRDKGFSVVKKPHGVVILEDFFDCFDEESAGTELKAMRSLEYPVLMAFAEERKEAISGRLDEF